MLPAHFNSCEIQIFPCTYSVFATIENYYDMSVTQSELVSGKRLTFKISEFPKLQKHVFKWFANQIPNIGSTISRFFFQLIF